MLPIPPRPSPFRAPHLRGSNGLIFTAPCGNGVPDAGEECDDGKVDSGDSIIDTSGSRPDDEGWGFRKTQVDKMFSC